MLHSFRCISSLQSCSGILLNVRHCLRCRSNDFQRELITSMSFLINFTLKKSSYVGCFFSRQKTKTKKKKLFLKILLLQTRLARLAEHVQHIAPYRPETACIVGNYYSLRGEHERALASFIQALKFNRRYLSAWLLLGYEFAELKNAVRETIVGFSFAR